MRGSVVQQRESNANRASLGAVVVVVVIVFFCCRASFAASCELLRGALLGLAVIPAICF